MARSGMAERDPAAAGRRGEDQATGRLTAAGWRILGRNVRIGRAELDIVAVDPGPPPELVIVEVRFRSRRDFGLAEETVSWQKRRVLRAALARCLAAGRLPDGTSLPRLAARLDLIVVEPPALSTGPPRMRHHRAAL